jgi:hypothetical protein
MRMLPRAAREGGAVMTRRNPDAEWALLGARLRRLHPRKFHQLLALTKAYVALLGGEMEPEEQWRARLAFIDAMKAEPGEAN